MAIKSFAICHDNFLTFTWERSFPAGDGITFNGSNSTVYPAQAKM
jgi:hypothetical protein